MNKKNRLVKIGIAAALSVLMAASSAQALTAALGLSAGGLSAYLPALAAALLCGLACLSGAMAVVSATAAVLLGGAAAFVNRSAIGAVHAWLKSFLSAQNAADAAVSSAAGGVIAAVSAVLLCGLLFVLLRSGKGSGAALAVCGAVLIVSYTVCTDMSFAPAAPGLTAALIALALEGGIPKDRGAWRALIPAVLAVGLALMLVPQDRVTWEPLEKAAQTVRAAFEDYFRFTQERISFTISTEGYNHAAEVNGEVETRLGGPAEPNTEPVMRVSADSDMLLRGSIRRTYTGSSWVDDGVKARYLYYDLIRANVREAVFSMEGNDGFAPVNVSVEMLADGTSALFVPARMESFSMGLETAVHYNSVGEMFLSRPAQAGDSYSLTGYQPGGAALEAAVIAASAEEDEAYREMLDTCTQLPEGIEQGVYELAVSLTGGLDNPWQKASAIEQWLRVNCMYTLKPDYPDPKRDFVSQFVLDSREGYCSYFASAMTVMCRMAGLPARYVEGYSVKAGQDVTVTGEDAHAWTEVYFSGLGWVAFDPATGFGGDGDGQGGGHDGENTPEDMPESGDPDQTPEPTAEPTPEPTTPPPGQDAQLPQDKPSPSPEPTDEPFSGVPEETPRPPQEPETQTNESNGGLWLWIVPALLVLLLLAVLAYLWIRARLERTDPIRLSGQTKTARQAALILYRSILTLLSRMGHAPMSGETPGAFARRVCGSEEHDFVRFADALSMMVYAGRSADREIVALGRSVYRGFETKLKKGERVRFALTRMLRGLGDFENIP